MFYVVVFTPLLKTFDWLYVERVRGCPGHHTQGIILVSFICSYFISTARSASPRFFSEHEIYPTKTLNTKVKTRRSRRPPRLLPVQNQMERGKEKEKEKEITKSSPVQRRENRHLRAGEHRFEVVPFYIFSNCRYCGEYIWISNKGVECLDCHYIAHLECAPDVPKDCAAHLRRTRSASSPLMHEPPNQKETAISVHPLCFLLPLSSEHILLMCVW